MTWSDAERDRHIREWLLDRKAVSNRLEFINCWRLLCDGVVIDFCHYYYGNEEFSRGMLLTFANNILRAMIEPDEFFDEYKKDMTNRAWLAMWHSRVGFELTDNLEVVPPGKKYPVSPWVYELNNQPLRVF